MNCPNCTEIITNVDVIDTEYFNSNYYDSVIGICSHCGKTYRWTEKFIFDSVMDVQEVVDNDNEEPDPRCIPTIMELNP